MNKPNTLKLVHSTNKQLISDEIIRAVVLAKDKGLAESIIDKFKFRSVLTPVNDSTQQKEKS